MKIYRQPNKIQQLVIKVKSIVREFVGDEFFMDMKERSEQKRAVKKAYRDSRFKEELKEAKTRGVKSVTEKNKPRQQEQQIGVFGNDIFNKGIDMMPKK